MSFSPKSFPFVLIVLGCLCHLSFNFFIDVSSIFSLGISQFYFEEMEWRNTISSSCFHKLSKTLNALSIFKVFINKIGFLIYLRAKSRTWLHPHWIHWWVKIWSQHFKQLQGHESKCRKKWQEYHVMNLSWAE
jgi:hypothetical protein